MENFEKSRKKNVCESDTDSRVAYVCKWY